MNAYFQTDPRTILCYDLNKLLYDVFISSHLQLHINGYSDVVNLFESTILHLQYGALGYESRETWIAKELKDLSKQT